MHIALLTDGITPYVTGGMQRHSYHLARQLLQRGIRLTLVHAVAADAVIPSEDEVAKLLDAPTGKLKVMGFHFPKSNSFPGHYVRDSYRLSVEIYESMVDEWQHFDFIYAKGFMAWALLEKKKKGVHTAPVGVKFHGYEMFQKTKNFRSRLEQYLLRPPVTFINRNANMVFSYGGRITKIIENTGVNPDRIIEIGSGIDESWLADMPKPQDGKRKFLFIGRDEKRKGIKDLMDCSIVFADTASELHWVGPLATQGQKDAGYSVYHGEVKDSDALMSIIDTCQILVVPSHAEGMPNVILEAMARGLAVIATDVGAVPMLVDSENGRRIPPAHKTALSQAIREFATMDASTLFKLRQGSIDRVRKNYRWSDVADETVSAIKRFTFSETARSEKP